MIGTSSVACSKPKCRPFKAILFIALGLYGRFRSFLAATCLLLSPGAVPAIHACLLHGLPRMFQMGFLYMCIMAVTYIAGGIAYAVRVPERFFPGKPSRKLTRDIYKGLFNLLQVVLILLGIAIRFYTSQCLPLFIYISTAFAVFFTL